MVSILYTGGTGRMGTVLREGLEGRYDDVRLFARSQPEKTFRNERVYLGDLADFESLREACQRVDVLLHFGGIADEREFEEILENNIAGTYSAFEAARQAGVRRIVYASSNHIIGFYPTNEIIDELQPVRPDSFYGVSKVFGEALGRLYHDKWGLEIVNLRIGSFRDEPDDKRQLSTWLSHPDGVELVRRSIESPNVGYEVVLGVSANDRKWWDYSRGAEAIGWVPQDNAERFAGRFESDTTETKLHGGTYTDPDYRGGYW